MGNFEEFFVGERQHQVGVSLNQLEHAKEQANSFHQSVALTRVYDILFQLLIGLLFQLAEVVHHLRPQGQYVEQHVGESHLVGVFDAFEFFKQACFLGSAVLRLWYFTDDDATHQGVVVALWRFLATDYHRGIHLIILNFPTRYSTAFLFAVAIVHNAFQCLELHIGDVLVVVLVQYHWHVPKRSHDGRHCGIRTCVQIEYGHSGRDEQRTNGYAYLCLTR